MTALVQYRHEFSIEANGPAMLEFTAEVTAWLAAIRSRDGLLTIFLKHTSASLTIQENVSPEVRADLLDALAKLAPETSIYRHNAEGADDMPAHIKAMLTAVSLSIPVFQGSLALGEWQGLFLIEHRRRSVPRTIVLHFVGSCL